MTSQKFKRSEDTITFCTECGIPYENTIEGLGNHIYKDPEHDRVLKLKIKADRELHKYDSLFQYLPFGLIGTFLFVMGVVVLLR